MTTFGISFGMSIEYDYREAGYRNHSNNIDQEVCEKIPCVICNGKCSYIGLKKELPTRTSYVAISRCQNCGNEFEF